MKKITSILLILCFCLFLNGCGMTDDGSATQTDNDNIVEDATDAGEDMVEDTVDTGEEVVDEAEDAVEDAAEKVADKVDDINIDIDVDADKFDVASEDTDAADK